jgi:hypothetical protein
MPEKLLIFSAYPKGALDGVGVGVRTPYGIIETACYVSTHLAKFGYVYAKGTRLQHKAV